jgi:hypothetical protein
MSIKRNFEFYNEIIEVPEDPIVCSIPYNDINGNMQLQISGTGTYTGLFQARLTPTSPFVNISVLNNTTNVVGTGFSAGGIYSLAISGLSDIQVVVSTLAGGNLTVVSKIIQIK